MDLFDDRGRIGLETRDLEFAERAAQAAHDREETPQAAESKSGDRLVTSPLSAIPNGELEWLWPGYLPLAKCVLLVGDPGLGKSMLTCDLSAPVSAGRTWPDGAQPLVRGDVLMLTAEDGVDDTVKPRVRAAGGDLDAVHVLTAVRTKSGDERSFTLDLDWELLTYDLDARAARGRPVRLVTLDPLVAFMGAVDTHVDAVVRRALTPLARIADDFRVTVLCVMHLNKSVQINAIYRTGGSIAFVAQARAVFAVTRDVLPGSKARLLLPIKMNLAPEPPALRFLPGGTPPALAWDAEPVGEVDLEAALRGHHDDDHDDRPATQLERAADFLRAELRAGPRESEELLRAAREQGISKRTLERAKSTLGVKSDRDGFGAEGHWYWSLE